MAKRPTVLKFLEGGLNKAIRISQLMESVCEISSTSQNLNSEKSVASNDDKKTETSQDTEERSKD